MVVVGQEQAPGGAFDHQNAPVDDVDLADLADLGAQVRAEWHAEYDETVGEARLQWEHGRTLMERVRDVMSRGDQVRIDVGDASFSGVFTDLGTNWCSCTTGSGTVEIQILNSAGVPMPFAMRRIARERSGGRRAPNQPIAFRAHLYELEMQREFVRVGSFSVREVLAGTLTVSNDHITVESADTMAWIPLDAISWVMTGGPGPRDA